MSSSPNKKKRASPDSVICIDLTGDDSSSSDNDDCKPAAKATPKRPKVKTEGTRSSARKVTPRFEDDGLEIVDAPFAASAEAASMPADEAEEEIQMVGGKNLVNLPHTRQNCTQNHFDPALYDRDFSFKRETIDKNKETCEQCYCYVCDKPATECDKWSSEDSLTRSANHCCANDAHAFWRDCRSAIKNPNHGASSFPYHNGYGDYSDDEGDSDDSGYGFGYSNNMLARALLGSFGGAPFTPVQNFLPPDSPTAARNKNFIKCRHCLFFTRFAASSYTGTSRRDFDVAYCHKCGRVARESDLRHLGIKQKNFKAQVGEVHFGRKVFEFTLETPDPRTMDRYKSHWESADTSSPQWKFSEQTMDYEGFCITVGPRPTPLQIRDIVRHWEVSDTSSCRQSVIKGLADQDYQLLSRLYSFNDDRSKITATWNKATRKGKLTVDVYICQSFFNTGKKPQERACFLGLWFGIFPFKITDLASSTMKMCSTNTGTVVKRLNCDYPRPNLTQKQRDDLKGELELMVDDFRTKHEATKANLKLLGSSGREDQGHICDDDTSLEGILKRFFGYSLPLLSHYAGFSGYKAWTGAAEKWMRDPTIIQALLGHKESVFLSQVVSENLERSSNRSIPACLQRIENLGHASVDYVEGLNCELLDFQRQSLKFALERETMPGGIQRLLWAKLPDNPSLYAKDLWYNVLTGRFRRDPPKLVRGGFCSEAMGLGKTVITLALILKNPAPQLPISGSIVSCIPGGLKAPWDEKLQQELIAENPKRGSVLSQGTLVICPVSLVGQWIEEAKSKLEDPGLVYPYHGGSRKRDAKILAKNSIVVTTYQVIASDATYHAKKGGDSYCPPLEQVRWWRVVCDEGHSLRESQTARSKAVLSIPGDHKWLVSGTPLNTSVKDLTNQFKFLGIENADEIIRVAGGTGNESSRRRYVEPIDPGLLTFALGGIMMRHTQDMKYRGTNTTLMQLPKKTERIVKIKFTNEEKTVYQELEKEASQFYVTLRSSVGSKITKHYLKVTSKLMPLRVACAGGAYPLFEEIEKTEENDNGSDDETIPKKGPPKGPKKYSEFVFTSKFNSLIVELEKIRDKDPSSKSLVFSQFSSTLEWLQEELPKHGFQYRTLKGDMSMQQRARALHEFQSDPPTTIFLLSVRSGAVGINLTQANRVFLMEPCFNPALESQAIGRVHRLGQKREVQITRFILEDSVESRLLKYLERKYGNSDKDDDAKNNGDENTANGSPSRPNAAAIVGNVAQDKAEMMTDDFDLLFGVPSLSSIDGMVDYDTKPMPDAAISGGDYDDEDGMI